MLSSKGVTVLEALPVPTWRRWVRRAGRLTPCAHPLLAAPPCAPNAAAILHATRVDAACAGGVRRAAEPLRTSSARRPTLRRQRTPRLKVCLSAVLASPRPPSSVSSPALPAPRLAFSFFCFVSLALFLSLLGAAGACLLVVWPPPFFFGASRSPLLRALSWRFPCSSGRRGPSRLPVRNAPPSLRFPCARPLAAPCPAWLLSVCPCVGCCHFVC